MLRKTNYKEKYSRENDIKIAIMPVARYENLELNGNNVLQRHSVILESKWFNL